MDADPLLRRHGPLVDVVDYGGRPTIRSKFGGWTTALFIIGVKIAEMFEGVIRWNPRSRESDSIRRARESDALNLDAMVSESLADLPNQTPH